MTHDLLTVQSLGTRAHLACVRGPDRGAIIPLRSGQVLGRKVGLLDPYSSAEHALISTTTKSVEIKETGPTNPSLRPGKARRLNRLRKYWAGSNLYAVRPRPLTPTWNVPEAGQSPGTGARWPKLLRLLLPVFFLLALSRFLPVPWVLALAISLAVTAGIWGLRRRSHRRASTDCAALALAAANTATSRGPSTSDDVAHNRGFSVLLKPGGTAAAHISAPGLCAVVGVGAEEYAYWVAGQLLAQGTLVEVLALQQWEPSKSYSAHCARVLWADDDGLVPPGIPTVLTAVPTGSGLWKSDMKALLSRRDEKGLPVRVNLQDLAPLDAESITTRWGTADELAARALRVPVGIGSQGPLELDLVRQGPHTLVVGGTGSGKSEFLSTLVLSLAAHYSPASLRFVFVDYKGGAGLDHLSGLPHVEQSLSDLDGALTAWLLRAIASLVRSRKVLCKNHGVRSVDEWHTQAAKDPTLPKPPARIAIVADEVRALADQHPDLLEELVKVCRQGRSLGIHLVAATQRPGGAVSSEMRSVLDLRVTLRCSEVGDSIDAIGRRDAADLPRIAGRAIVADQEVQLAYCEDPEQVLLAISKALEQTPTSSLPQFPVPLPHRLQWSDVAASSSDSSRVVLGLQEEPPTCEIRALTWGQEPLLIAGPIGVKEQLRNAAVTAATSAANLGNKGPLNALWVGPLPSSLRRFGFVGLAERPSASDMAHLLVSASKSVDSEHRGILVIPNLSQVRSVLDHAAGPDATNRVMLDLVDAAHRGWLTLIATDTSPRGADLRHFETFLLKVASARIAQSPELAALLPHRDESPWGSGSSIEHWVSPQPQRFVASGFGMGPTLSLLAEGTPAPLAKTRPAPAYEPYLHFEDADAIRAFLTSTAPQRPAQQVTRIQVIAGAHLDSTHLEIDLRETLNVPVEKLTLEQWHRLDHSPLVVKVALEPNREVCRVLSALDPSSAPWLMASVPFEPKTGVIVVHASNWRLKLGARYTDVTLCTPKINGLGLDTLAERAGLDET